MVEATQVPVSSAVPKKKFGWGAIVLSVLIFLTLAGIIFVLAANI